ncbi:lipocalin family protein [Flagellimonas lutaonensis]|uniref:Conserved hypothetical periplasmic protein n=1 Tax=Flagellimonas lutaonensis TaxID=516051 RepID=A0A0D5YNP5_9FLAO|nr:lipocalin family protein [Allomuricauda lutaonensis]AKA33950.1 Conserved hypothetical periplasmic protein [Allomuricauda lutaonensis]
MRSLLVVVFICVLGCRPTVSESDLPLLNGYWEIEKVVFSDGNTKQYQSSTTIDYIELEGRKGFRKKVYPKLDGSFEVTNDAEFFTLKVSEKGFVFDYDTGLSEWQEELTQLSSDHFSVVNEDGVTYKYKRFDPINITR